MRLFVRNDQITFSQDMLFKETKDKYVYPFLCYWLNMFSYYNQETRSESSFTESVAIALAMDACVY